MISIIPWIIVGMIFYTIGEYYAKKYANTSLKSFGFASLIGYFICTCCFLPALSKYNSLSILGTIWNLLYLIITLFLGIIVFKETLTTVQIVGIGFGFIAIILMSL